MRGWRGFVARGFTAGWKVARQVTGVQPGFRVLMYHAVGTQIPEDKLGLYTLSPQTFLEQMEAAAAEALVPVISFGEANTARQGLAITFDDGYRDVFTEAAPLLAKLGLPFTVFATSDYIQSDNSLYLSPQELRELADLPGATIGAHGASHVKLTECSDDALREELVGSRSYLEDLLQRPVTTLSYPHGAVDTRVRVAAMAAGYMMGACSRFGTNRADRDPMLLKRTDIWSTDGVGDFQSKVAGDWDWMGWRG